MSKLEDLWDGTPTGKPPVDAILAAGRAEAARRRKLRQTVLAVGATAAVVGAFVAGAAVGNGPGPHVSASRSDASPAAFQADLEPAQSCAQLLESYRDRGLGIVTAWGWGLGVRREYAKAKTSMRTWRPRRLPNVRPAANARRRRARPARTCRRPASTSPTRSRPTATSSCGCAAVTWSSTTRLAPRWSSGRRSTSPASRTARSCCPAPGSWRSARMQSAPGTS